MTKGLPAFLCALVLFAAPAAVHAQEPGAGSAVASARELQLTTLDGRPARLSDHHGQLVGGQLVGGQLVVLNFWATWCVPCREEMPMLSALQAAYQARGVLVIGVSVDDASTRGRVPAFVR